MAGLTLVLGGARSGKSRFAEDLARRSGLPVVYLATGTAADAEMADRIARHRAARPPEWITVEEPLDPARGYAALPGPGVLVVDCIGFLVTNHLLRHPGNPDAAETAVGEALDRLAAGAAGQRAAVVVSNEAGMGVVPEYPLGRQFRDALGRANQRLAAAAGAVFITWAGIPVEIKALAWRAEGTGDG